MTGPGRSAVVLMAYGTPAHRDDVAAYYTDIRRGRPPTDDQLADLLRRYEAIGGLSPLTQRTEAQRAALQAGLGPDVPVVLGYKHVTPSIEDAVASAVAAGAEHLVGVVLAPHYSSASVGGYLARMTAAAPAGVSTCAVRSWAIAPAFVRFCAAEVRRGLDALPAGSRLVVTAHSLPQRVIDGGDPYVDELTATATAVASAAGLPADRWQIGWQSAGRTPEPWLGPDILDIIDTLAGQGAPGVLVAAVGFVADHLEVLYDLDIDAAAAAQRCGIRFARTACVNDDAGVMGALAGLVRSAIDESIPHDTPARS
jgi:ferrochelatase